MLDILRLDGIQLDVAMRTLGEGDIHVNLSGRSSGAERQREFRIGARQRIIEVVIGSRPGATSPRSWADSNRIFPSLEELGIAQPDGDIHRGVVLPKPEG